MTQTFPSSISKRNILKIYWLEAKYEFLKAIRIPIFAISTLAFPTLFYIFFGLTFGQGNFGPINAATYYLASYGTFGIIGAALFGFGAGIAAERGQGWMRLKRASPMPPLVYFVAKLFMAVVFSCAIVLILWLLGVLFGEVRLPFITGLHLLGILIFGTLPFAAMGMALGYSVGPNSAPAVVNLIYLPMAFASGLWLPIQILPQFIQVLAPFLPAYHLSQLALGVIGADRGGSSLQHFAVLALYTLVFLALAVFLYRRDEGKTYG